MAKRHPHLLDQSTVQAVRRIAAGYLKDAASALTRIRDPKDHDALHNFRVAVRHLRSLLRAYRPWLGSVGGRKVRRRLRKLTRLTGAGRDAEVQIEWLELQRRHLDARERNGLDWLIRRLRARRQLVYRTARKKIGRDFERVAQMLRDRIESAEGGHSKGFRDAFCGLVQLQGREFEQRLGALASADDVEAAHQARIGTKRLRYLVEPLRAQLPEARAVIKSLKRLQDRLGKLHDMHVLESEIARVAEGAAAGKAGRLHALARERRRDRRPGLVAIAARARMHRKELFNELGRSGLRKCRRELAAQIGELLAVAMRSDGTVEFERKYLLKAMPPMARSVRVQEIEQGWLPGKRLRERLRRVRDADGERFYRTIKLGAGVQRLEIEEETTAELFGALWPHTEGCRVRKRRHQVQEGRLTWEIDRFQDRNLVLAEVELTEAGMEAEPPKWLKPYVVREVTVDPAFLNLNLAR